MINKAEAYASAFTFSYSSSENDAIKASGEITEVFEFVKSFSFLVTMKSAPIRKAHFSSTASS